MIRLITGTFSTVLLLTIATAISQPPPSPPPSTALSPATKKIAAPPAHPPQLPITEVHLWVAPPGTPWEMGRLTVPDLDTTLLTQPGSPLRNYDRHIARLFETTYQQCKKKPTLQGMTWQYEAANGNIPMGEFRLRCQTTHEVVSGYHLMERDRQPTKTESFTNGGIQVSLVDVPKLHIVGKKADRWLDYVQTIRPVFSPAQRRLEQVQVFPNDRILHNRLVPGSVTPTIPLRIPQELPMVMKVADRFVLTGTNHGYQLCPATLQGDCDRSRPYGFQQMTGRKGGAFYEAKTLTPGAVYRPIELANRTPGIYLENCVGQRCLSIVQWKQDGILYEIQAQYREQPVLVKIANSAIEANPMKSSAIGGGI